MKTEGFVNFNNACNELEGKAASLRQRMSQLQGHLEAVAGQYETALLNDDAAATELLRKKATIKEQLATLGGELEVYDKPVTELLRKSKIGELARVAMTENNARVEALRPSYVKQLAACEKLKRDYLASLAELGRIDKEALKFMRENATITQRLTGRDEYSPSTVFVRDELVMHTKRGALYVTVNEIEESFMGGRK